MTEEAASDDPSSGVPAGRVAAARSSSRRLRFLQTKGLIPPYGYLNLDECLHRVGSKRLGTVWDRIITLRCFPFRHVKQKRAFYRYRVHADRPYGLQERRIIVKPADKSAFRSADRHYRVLRRALSDAIQARKFEVRLIAPDGRVTEISHLGLFATQVVRAFYTGTVVIKDEGLLRKRRVLVDERSFTRWLEHGDTPRQEHRTLGSATFRPLLPAIAEHARQKSYKLTEADFHDLLEEVAREAIPPVTINKAGIGAMWKDEALTTAKKAGPGPRREKDRNAFAQDRPHLKEFLISRVSQQQKR